MSDENEVRVVARLVVVQHFRKQKGVEGAAPARYLRGKGFLLGKYILKGMPEEKGGFTQVFVALGGQVFVDRAHCRPDEGFCYKSGRGEAIRKLNVQLKERLGVVIVEGVR